MNISKIKVFSFATILATLAFVACKDEFSEQDFLKLQSDLAIKADSAKLLAQFKANGAETEAQAASYVAALNEAGDLLGVSILVREDNKPVEGVSVAINTVSAPVTTNASGIAYFDRVRIGEATVLLSKPNYTSASALVTFGTPSAPVSQSVTSGGVTTTRYVAPTKRFENIGLPLFAVGGTGSTATIKGRVTYERDLTNQTPEIPRIVPAAGGAPTPITVQINLRTALSSQITTNSSAGGNAEVLSYQVADGAFGSSSVDLITGNYSMVVPATVGGITGYSFIIPEITENQTLVITTAPDATGLSIPLANGPELRNDVPAKWSSSYLADPSPTVASAFLYVPEPPLAGRGFAPTFSALPRQLETGTFGNISNSNLEMIGNTVIKFNTRGQGYTSAPTVTFSAPLSGTTTALAGLRGYVAGANITVGGAGYPATVFLQFTQVSANGVVTPLIGVETVPVGSAGTLPTGPVTLPTSSGYVGNATQFITDAGISGLGVRLVDAAGTPLANTSAMITPSFKTEINGIQITSAGVYSTAPTITFSGGGSPTTQAEAIVQEFRVQWEMNFPTAAPTTPYKVLPSDFTFIFPAYAASNQISNKNIEVVGSTGDIVAAAAALVNQLSSDGTTIIKESQFANLMYRTSTFWHVSPVLEITDATRTRAAGTLSIDNTTGKIQGINMTSTGAGYDEATLKNAANGVALRPAYPNAPGTGATVNLSLTVNASSREATIGSVTLGNNGSGYRSFVNTASAGPAFDAIPPVRTGQTYNVDVRLGTGDRPAGYN